MFSYFLGSMVDLSSSSSWYVRTFALDYVCYSVNNDLLLVGFKGPLGTLLYSLALLILPSFLAFEGANGYGISVSRQGLP